WRSSGPSGAVSRRRTTRIRRRSSRRCPCSIPTRRRRASCWTRRCRAATRCRAAAHSPRAARGVSGRSAPTSRRRSSSSTAVIGSRVTFPRRSWPRVRFRYDGRAMTSGAAVVIVGGGVTGLSAGWWLARAGVDVLVLERGILGWEASGRNGGGATHVYSPFGLEEQRLWPQMDVLLGYPTEYQPYRIGVALSEAQLALARRWAEIGGMRGFRWESLDSRAIWVVWPIVGATGVMVWYVRL